jgi:hypothetical protein
MVENLKKPEYLLDLNYIRMFSSFDTMCPKAEVSKKAITFIIESIK